MNKTKYQDYLLGEHWANLRLLVLQRDDFRCVRCTGAASEVHHKRYRDSPFDSKPDDLVSLCSRCHSTHHQSKHVAAKNNALFADKDRVERQLAALEQKRLADLRSSTAGWAPDTINHKPWYSVESTSPTKGRWALKY